MHHQILSERILDSRETQMVYNEICVFNLHHFAVYHSQEFSEYYFNHKGKQYRLIYDHSGDRFCDIIYEGEYYKKPNVQLESENCVM